MASKAGDAAANGRRLRIPRRIWAVAVVVVLAILLAVQNYTVLFPNMSAYRLVDQRTIALTVAVAPCAWTRVTGVTETGTQIAIKVETLPCPLPGPSTSELDLHELTVSVAADVADRIVTDAQGQPVPLRPSGP